MRRVFIIIYFVCVFVSFVWLLTMSYHVPQSDLKLVVPCISLLCSRMLSVYHNTWRIGFQINKTIVVATVSLAVIEQFDREHLG